MYIPHMTTEHDTIDPLDLDILFDRIRIEAEIQRETDELAYLARLDNPEYPE